MRKPPRELANIVSRRMEDETAVHDENAPVPSTATTVKMLPRSVATQICTSQVIISAAGAVRQLLDNAMDAKAKNIEVNTLNFGIDSIRVSDDGTGIEERNFDSLCKRHATSKITEYDDLLALSTLGFRGEALNALCALGSVTITTRTADKDVATRLHFDHSGVIEKREAVPMEMGTTVEVRSLFTTLPVRRKEFERSAKRDFHKVVGVVQEFALATPSVRFNVYSELATVGRRYHALSTPGGDASLSQVITELFGGSEAKNEVIEIHSDETTMEGGGLEEGQVDEETVKEAREMRLDGFVSSPLHDNGRTSSERQFVYVNGRPVDYPKVCRAVNEIYQVHNRRQYPTLVLKITMPAEWVDVNVTPDKRLVFCQKERALLYSIRSTITAAFKPYENLMASLEKKSTEVKKEVFSQSFATSPVVKSPAKSQKRKYPSVDSDAADSSMRSDCSEINETDRMNSVLEDLHANDWGLGGGGGAGWRTGGGSDKHRSAARPKLVYHTAKGPSDRPDTISPDGSSRDTVAPSPIDEVDPMGTVVSINTMEPGGFRSREICQPQTKKSKTLPTASSMGMRTLQSFSFKITPHVSSQQGEGGGGGGGGEVEGENRMDMDARRRIVNRSYDEEREREDELIGGMHNDEPEPANRQESGHVATNIEVLSQQSIKQEVLSQSFRGTVEDEREDTVEQMGDRSKFTATRKEQKLKCSLDGILKMREKLTNRMEEEKEKEEGLEELKEGPSAVNEAAAEEQLRRAIRKSDFADMEIVGQFNSGFIITKLNGHLFIVDQHASDEKANFEKFQKSAVVKNQETIRPQPLSMGAVAETIVRDNIGIFNASGFRFVFPEDGSGAQLVSLPVVHGASFDRKDIDELISSLTVHPGVMVRPSKLNKVFASKACRSSVMIGARLTKEKMKTIVNQLGKLDHPWSCPHGRPTLRHLANLKKLEDIE
ncbi:pms-2 [Pristionchus pacificus]|uniref:Uncharacterized protein n=1 Tax=Pristionchus pacificus TaxID=54126 RepID=A0A2A6BMV3_PRIPA|nr:pms-2 [Pristionchus pacificus]|eukprot:PDM67126.1 hypothetical protein PRIPAC_48543 [Pristionchus pacificus]